MVTVTAGRQRVRQTGGCVVRIKLSEGSGSDRGSQIEGAVGCRWRQQCCTALHCATVMSCYSSIKEGGRGIDRGRALSATRIA